MSQLSKRGRMVLYAVVSEYTATGEPVGSRTLVKKYGFDLSAATVRNVLADLEESGFLAQPHTSAGRVPTERAFRLFIDALMRTRELTPEQLGHIAAQLGSLPPGADMSREAGKLLSSLTGAVSLVARSQIETRTLLKLRFIPTRPGEVLSVIVLSDGTVENRYIAVESPLSSSELERLHNMLEELVEGRTVSGVRDELARRATAERDELIGLLDLGRSLLSAAIAKRDRLTDVIIEGHANALDSPEFESADRARELMRALEEREKLVLLLDRTIQSQHVQVFLGEETSQHVGYPLSIVAAPFREGGRPVGSVGIIGPTRMDYPTVLPIVEATADAMTAALSRSGRESPTRDEDGAGADAGDGQETF